MTWPLPPIACAQCRHEVQEVVIERVLAAGPSIVRVTAYCHGQTDVMEFDFESLHGAEFVDARAFVERKALK